MFLVYNGQVQKIKSIKGTDVMVNMKKLCACGIVATILVANLASCSSSKIDNQETTTTFSEVSTLDTTTESKVVVEEKIPKYVFLFIGDGMGYPQIQATSYFKGKSERLSFMDYDVVGSVDTYNVDTTITDSASAATAIATGYKTSTGTVSMNPPGMIKYETIVEQLKRKLGYKIGIITSVSLNHATPAAFYAHSQSRDNYYEIGEQLAKSDVDFFAGGGFTDSTGEKNNKKSLYKCVREEGYNIYRKLEDKESLKQEDSEKTILISEKNIKEGFMKYDMDLEEDEWHLCDYVSKGIEMLDNDKGFFMMVESGKIDYANHSNDAATMIRETLAFDEAVQNAYKFYQEHPDETLIIVTADHESGGLSVGYSQTAYSTYLSTLRKQKMSFYEFENEYVTGYKNKEAPFEKVIADIEKIYGTNFDEDEMQALMDAYFRTLEVGALSKNKMNKQEYELYGKYDPLTVTISHIMNHKAGLDYTTYSHTGIQVPLYATGIGSDEFYGYYDNTDIYKKIYKIMKLGEKHEKKNH